MKLFTGNCPESVCKTAKYHIRRENGKFVVGINYNTGNGEYWTPTTELHPDLVEMVNNVKNEINSSPGGAFYINEFRQVIVPAEGKYFLAGKYEKSLQFSILNDDGEYVVISGKAVDLQGNALNPGDEWYGYLMGIPYVLAAGGNDIRFEIKLNANHFRRIPLSKTTSVSAAKSLAQNFAGSSDILKADVFISMMSVKCSNLKCVTEVLFTFIWDNWKKVIRGSRRIFLKRPA